MNANRTIGVKVLEDWGRGETKFESVEGGLDGGGPVEFLALLEE